MKNEPNALGIGSMNSLANAMTPQQQQYQSLIDFKNDYQKGARNVFVYAPERLNIKQFMGGAQNIAGAFYTTAPDQYSYTTLTGTVTRKLGDNPQLVTLDINYNVLANYEIFSDTSSSDFSCNLYFTLLNIYSDAYIETGDFPIFNLNVEPLIVINSGVFTWRKSTTTYNFKNFVTNINLKNTIQNRDIKIIANTSYPDFEKFPDRLTQDQYEKFILKGDRPLAISLCFDGTNLSNNNAAFLASNFYCQASCAFNYYAVLANF
jgi:hypothetical protein